MQYFHRPVAHGRLGIVMSVDGRFQARSSGRNWLGRCAYSHNINDPQNDRYLSSESKSQVHSLDLPDSQKECRSGKVFPAPQCRDGFRARPSTLLLYR